MNHCMTSGLRCLFAAMAFAAIPGVAHARVDAVDRDGFSVTLREPIAASPDAVFAALGHPEAWWNDAHSWSGNAANLHFEPRAGGCWCETVPDGGSVEHGRVIAYLPGQRRIVLQSLLGPLQSMAVAGRLNWQVEAGQRPNDSTLVWTYQVSILPTGNPEQDAALAAAVDAVLDEQMGRLAAYVTAASRPTP